MFDLSSNISLNSLDEEKARVQSSDESTHQGSENCHPSHSSLRALCYKALHLEAIALVKLAGALNKPGAHQLPWNRHVSVFVTNDTSLWEPKTKLISGQFVSCRRFLDAFVYKERLYTITRNT